MPEKPFYGSLSGNIDVTERRKVSARKIITNSRKHGSGIF